jgi:hypothetical protein
MIPTETETETERQNITKSTTLTYNKRWCIENGRVYDVVPVNDAGEITYEYAKINSVYEKHKKSLMNSSRDFFHLVLHISSTAKMYDFVVKYIVPDFPTKKDMKNCEVVRIFSHKVAKKDRLDRQISYERLLED